MEEETALDPTEFLGIKAGVAVRVEKPLFGAILSGGSNTIAECRQADKFGIFRPNKATPKAAKRSSTTALRASTQASVERPFEAKCTPDWQIALFLTTFHPRQR